MELSLEPINITKEIILNRVSEEQIMEHYLGIPIQKGLFRSPLRRDDKPTCSFYRDRRGRLIMKDFSGAFSGDAFAVVMEKFQCSYYMALQIIANDFGIIRRKDLTKHRPKIEYSGIKFEEKESAKIQIQTREFNEKELNWWLSYGITKQTLEKFRVYPVDKAWLNNHLFYQNIDNKLVFGYYGGIKDGNELWRLYFSQRKSYKFISNWKSNQIQGIHMIPKEGGEYIVVTKSLKDCMCLYEFGIPAIAPCSENLFLTNEQYAGLCKLYKRVYLLYDNDLPGIHAMNKFHKEHPNLICLKLNRNDAKDISDYRKAFGYKKTLDLINFTKQYYGEK